MKIKKSQLQTLIKEEIQRSLKEHWQEKAPNPFQELETETFRRMLADRAITYPRKTFLRRLGMLSEKEVQKIQILEEKILLLMDKIDEIISARAEKEQDPWP